MSLLRGVKEKNGVVVATGIFCVLPFSRRCSGKRFFEPSVLKKLESV